MIRPFDIVHLVFIGRKIFRPIDIVHHVFIGRKIFRPYDFPKQTRSILTTNGNKI
jgi:hypothetical protein